MVTVLIVSQSFLLGLSGEQYNRLHHMIVLYDDNVNALKQYVDLEIALSQIVSSEYTNSSVILNPYLP